MAYYLHHIAQFENRITERIKIELYKKDNVPSSVTDLIITSCQKSFLNGTGDKFDVIIASEVVFNIWLSSGTNEEFDAFIVSFHDEWKVILKNDDQIDFVGFLTPGEGAASLRDKPYELTLSATDGLGYLKKQYLTKTDGTKFADYDWISIYIIGALQKTGCDLPVRFYVNIYEESMPDRAVNPFFDGFSNVKLNYRTFLTDPVTFMFCYDAIEAILKEGFRLFQWFGRWVIMRIGEMQESAGPKLWYTEYTKDGVFSEANQELHDPAQIAKNQILHPINADHTISSNFAIKSAKHTYNYEAWPEIPKNSKFEYGTPIIGIGGTQPDGTTQQARTINDWVFGRTAPGSPSTFPPNLANASPDRAYRLSTYNIFGVEILREVVLENGATDGHRFLMSEGLPVHASDKVEINLDFKKLPNVNGFEDYLMVMLVPDGGGNQWKLQSTNDITKPVQWNHTGALQFIRDNFVNGTANYTSESIDVPPIPEDGKLYILFLNYDSTGTRAFFKNFSVAYHPYVAGGYVEAKGDYWITQQNPDYKDIIDEQVSISDSDIKILKGALFRNNAIDLTTRTWHRFNVNEKRHFKELVNLGRYDACYRRMWKIQGTFGGIMYHPADNETYRFPLGFHKHFFFPGVSKLAGKYFELVPPLTIDYKEGQINAVFIESIDINIDDKNQQGDLHEFHYNFT